MATPYEGKVCLWHWEGDAVGEATIGELINTIEQRCPVADSVFVKTSDGGEWQGNYDSKTAMRIDDPSDISRWVSALDGAGLDFHGWCVVRGVDVDDEIDVVSQAASVQGVKSIILDVEPYSQYWQGSRNDVIRLMSGIRNRIGNSFHIGLSIDPRSHWYDDIYPDAWRPYVNSVHPQCYWGTMQRTPEDILTEAYVVWGGYGLPIYPVLQAHGVSPDSIQQAQDIARSVRGATGLSYWRLGVIGPSEFEAINEETVDTEVGPDNVWRRYGWEKIIAPGEQGYMDGTHTGQSSSEAFDEMTSVRGHTIKYKSTQASRDTVWALWRPHIPAGGLYEISVFVPGRHATTSDARYHVHGITGVASELRVPLDQSRYYDQWVPLLVYEFNNQADGAQINLTDLTGEDDKEISFGAIRWRQVLEQGQPSEEIGFDSPVGTAAERSGEQVWPGTWFDATGFATYYTAVGAAYHTGADLNNNRPSWNSDCGTAVYAPADGRVTFSGTGSGTWGWIIVIRHDPLSDGKVYYTRFAHVASPRVQEGDRVERGQQVAAVGDAGGRVACHLHFDICKTGILEQKPSHWPGLDLDEVYENYVDPREFIINHRPGR
jgi:murein DD-endopeptidase MepM/ murein hydrolase activator NlpD